MNLLSDRKQKKYPKDLKLTKNGLIFEKLEKTTEIHHIQSQ